MKLRWIAVLVLLAGCGDLKSSRLASRVSGDYDVRVSAEWADAREYEVVVLKNRRTGKTYLVVSKFGRDGGMAKLDEWTEAPTAPEVKA